jgi:hypothetical protein
MINHYGLKRGLVNQVAMDRGMRGKEIEGKEGTT